MKKIHFIGICGVAMSALALAFKRAGHAVTGSDVGFYPPISTHLKDAGVDFYAGWHPEKVLASFKEGSSEDEIVVVGNVASSTNPEWMYVQKHGLNHKSYPEIIKEFFVKQNSIVCAGTYGKTTSTALLTWILQHAGFDPTYMFGGLMAPSPFQGEEGRGLPSSATGVTFAQRTATLSNSPLERERSELPLPSANITNADWSVLEGDEYKASKWDNGPKFAYYSPTHLLLSSVVWDHADVYPTEEKYFTTFETLIKKIPKKGLRVISEKVDAHLLAGTKAIRYGKTAGCDYVFGKVVETKHGVSFEISHQSHVYQLEIPCLGEYMADNATGCFAMANQLGVAPEKIIAAIKTFPGMKRRLEKRFEGTVTVFDDIAHSPTKAQATLASLRHIYSKKIIAVFEPNTGNREMVALPGYKHAFAAANEVLLPTFTKIKQRPDAHALEADELVPVIAQTHKSVRHIAEDAELIAYITKTLEPGDAVIFLGSHGFRGMIEELISKLSL